MSNNIWIGQAPAIAQVDTFTPGTVTSGNTFTITGATGQAVTVTATATTAANVTALFVVAIAASGLSEFSDANWVDLVGTLTATARTAGQPLSWAVSHATGGGSSGNTFTKTATVASSSPSDVSLGANWSLGTVPDTGDAVKIGGGTPAMLWNLNQSAKAPASVEFLPDYRQPFGLPYWNPAGYIEWRPTYLAFGCTTWTVNCNSSRGRIDTGSTTATILINGMGSSTDTGLEALLLKGTALTPLHNKGSVASAVQAGETSTLVSGVVGYITNPSSDAKLRLGSGCTISGTWVANGGTIETNSAGTWVINSPNVTLTHKAGALSVVNKGGKVLERSSTATTSYAGENGDTLDYTTGPKTKTNAAYTGRAGSKIRSRGIAMTWSAGIICDQCGINDLDIDLGSNLSFAPTLL